MRVSRTGIACGRATDVEDETLAATAFAERLAQRCDVHPQTRFLDDGLLPDAGLEFGAGQDLAGAVHEQLQQVERTAAESDRLIALEELPFAGEEPKAAERERVDRSPSR